VSQAAHVDGAALLAALEACIGYTPATVLQVGQQVCLPPWSPSCKFTATTEGRCKAYVVQMGDTVGSVATSFGVAAAALQGANKAALPTAATPLQPGQRLRLPPWDDQRCSDTAVDDAPTCRAYAVKAGDSLASVATMFTVTGEALLAANPDVAAAGGTLSVGQPVHIPPFPSSCGVGTLTEPPPSELALCRAYYVREGDSVASIAVQFGSTVDGVTGLNPDLAAPALLTPGRSVRIPPWDDSCAPEGVVVPGT
jgi:LysM repeat protein